MSAIMASAIMLSVTFHLMLNRMSLCLVSYADCRYAECHLSLNVMPNVSMLSVICGLSLC
jgi:hypothetical protein